MAANETAPASVSLLDPILDFLRLLWAVEHGLQRKSKSMEAEYGVTGPQRLVLKIVERYPGISAGELAHIVRLHPSTLTGILQRLVSRGLIERTSDPNDSRRACLVVHRRAMPLTRLSSGTIEAAVTRALDESGPVAVRTAGRVLTAIARELEGL
jgi:MarR family transcriptional regulator, organic hydroperoxide resistance regulator